MNEGAGDGIATRVVILAATHPALITDTGVAARCDNTGIAVPFPTAPINSDTDYRIDIMIML